MKIARSIFLFLVLVFPLGTIMLGQAEALTTWDPVSEGIEYQKFRLTNPVPVDVFVARMARSNPNVTIESSIAQGRLSGGTETVSNMAKRYDGALNFWGPPTIPVSSTWGSTNDVIVAINGFYYGNPWENDGVPWSGQIHSGWYAKRFYENENSSGFVWKMDRSAFIGGCISHPDDKEYVYKESGEMILIDGVNQSRNDDELILYTPQYDRDTNTDSSNSTEVLVEMQKPSYTSVFGNMPYGTVQKIRTNQGSTPIPYDHVVLSAQGAKVQALTAQLAVGQEVGIAQRVKDCLSEPPNDWDLAYAGVGGHWRFLRNGVIFPYDDDGQALVRDPRTAIAFNSQYIFFIVADGRNPGISEGMTVKEMANFAKNTLGATDGIMQDGGGSSTMVVNGQVVNNTYCNNEFCPGITGYVVYLPMVINVSDPSAASVAPEPGEPMVEWDAELGVLQRLVANGMMMVVVQPKEVSSWPYHQGDPVTTVGEIDIRLGPGTNYAVLNTANGNGWIVDPVNQLGGVFAKESYWWKVDFEGDANNVVDGWVPESAITPGLKLRSINVDKAR